MAHPGAVLGNVSCLKPFFDLKNEPIAPPHTSRDQKLLKKQPESNNMNPKVLEKRPASRTVF